jgi:hypothetical protein
VYDGWHASETGVTRRDWRGTGKWTEDEQQTEDINFHGGELRRNCRAGSGRTRNSAQAVD